MFVLPIAPIKRVASALVVSLLFLLPLKSVIAESETLNPKASGSETSNPEISKQAAMPIPHSVADEKRLLRRLGNIKTVYAEFVQKLYTSESNEPQITEGTLQVAGLDKFRLEYTKPYEQLYVANGKEFLFYDVDLEQITIKPQLQELSNTPAMILSNPQIFVKKYYVKINKEAFNEEYILTSKSDTSAYNKILLSFKNTRLDTMLIEDSFGQETELQFKKIIYNKKIAASTFNYIPPEGIDVIRSTIDTNIKTEATK